MLEVRLTEALTFDDVLLVPQQLRRAAGPSRRARPASRATIALKIPIVSAAMDTVTEAHLAIALAQEGGIGFIHKNMTIEAPGRGGRQGQALRVGDDRRPRHRAPDAPVAEALALMAKYRISGVPVTDGPKLVGILTNRDLRFETRTNAHGVASS